MKIKKDILLDLVYGGEHPEIKVVKQEIVDRGRWSIHYECIIQKGEKFFDASYSEGATESQYEEPFEFEETDENGNLELEEVFPVEKVITIYRAKE